MRMLILFGAAAFACLSARAQQWPVSPDPHPEGSKIDKPIYATIDIVDDMWRSQSRFSRQNMVSLMKYLARIGISRVYWLRAPDGTSESWLIPSQGSPADAECIVVQAAHDAGLECYAIYKPFETGCLTTIYPQTYPFPASIPTIEVQSGRLMRAAPFIVEHPEFRIRRRPLPVDPDQAVTAIKLVKSDDAPTHLKAENLQIWTSHDNGNFKRLDAPFSFNEGIEQRDGKSIRVLTISSLNIPADQRYFMVCTVGLESPADKPFANVPAKLVELYGAGGAHLPSNGDDGVIRRDTMMASIITLCIQLHGSGAIPPELALPESYGKTLESSSFNFGLAPSYSYGASPVPERVLESAGGYIAVAKGKDMSMPVPHPFYPEVRAYWLSEIQSLIDSGFDGIDIRIDNHSTWLAEAGEYGFNEPVVKAYQDQYGVDILTENFDPVRWRGIQGDSYTRFLKEARDLTRRHNRPLDLHINGVLADATPGFDLNNLPKTIEWQWERWISEDLCTGIHLKLLPWPWGSYRGKGQDFAVKAIELARRHGKSVNADARINKWKLVTTQKGADTLSADDVAEVVDSLRWPWRSKSIDAINLYEVFDFVQIDLASGKVHGSPAFEQILDAIRGNREDTLRYTELQNWITLETANPQ